ncbi:MAG: NAD-dependent epimerase/dehydratase family protein [Aquificaceae bacterium]|nr:NAD-dependent epimerase/dehydratase family protein [Aquificaceae bacterium]
MIVVTGALGFIGRNMCKFLNGICHEDLILVDSPTKWENAIGLRFYDLLDYRKGIDYLSKSIKNYVKDISVIFHIGAKTDVLLRDINSMMEYNFEHSKMWLEIALNNSIPLIYVSSSAIYGNSGCFRVDFECEHPHNEYAFSKYAFDCYVRHALKYSHNNKVIGFRVFNVFGLGESHKDKNASIPYRFYRFILDKGYIDLFQESIRRDYVWVVDVCRVLYEAWKRGDIENGIYNLGSGEPVSHQEVAEIVIQTMAEEGVVDAKHMQKYIVGVEIPSDIKSRFQFYTKAEELMPWIKEITMGNREKIRGYIKQLCEISRRS